MGLLQRFARPEFRPGQAPESPPEDERHNRAPVPADGGTDQGGGSVSQSDAFSQEAGVSEDASPSLPQPSQPSQPQPAPTAGATPSAPAQPPPAEPEVRKTEVFAFANQKGGVAKTTTTLNLAVALAEKGHRVLAVDLDPQGNLTMSQGIDPDSVEKSMYDVLVNDMSIREVIRKREIDIACASIDLAGAEIAMSAKIGRERSLEKALRPVLEDYDFVCIDTPPSLGLLTINALTAAAKVIVPVQCEYLSMRGLIQLQNTLSMIRDELNPNVQIEGILPTLVDSRTVHAKEAIEILEENFGDRVFATRIRKTIRFAEAPVKGTSVLKYDPDGVAAESYRDLAKEVLANGRR
jgi:chromosome partitioning protein